MKKTNLNRRPISAKPAVNQNISNPPNLICASLSQVKKGNHQRDEDSQFQMGAESPEKTSQNDFLRFSKLLDQFDPLELRKEKYKTQLKKYKQLLAKVSFFDPEVPAYERKYQYSYEKIMPYVFFFKYMARKPDGPEDKQKNTANRLKVWLPDTLVFNDGDLPAMWFYTSQNGQVFRADSFNKRNIIQKFGEHCSPDELVCVMKKELAGNDVNIVSKSELDSVSTNLFADKNQLTILQRFVKSNGPKAFISRTVWRKDKNPYAWIITNKLDYKDKSDVAEIKKYVINMQVMNSCTIVESKNGKFVEETVPYLDNIGRYFHIHLGITFKEIIGDFIKDESGIWWLVNIHGFLLDKYEIPINVKAITNYGDGYNEVKRSPFADIAKQKETYQRVKPCKYCEEIFPVHELTNKLTLKMILQTDKHLQNRGKNYEWLNRTDMKHIDTPMLYQEHKVCSSCFKLYVEIDKLITAECNFARYLGIPVTDENRVNLTSATLLNGFYGTMNAPNQSKVNNFIDNPNDKQMPLNWEFNIEPETEIIVKNNLPSAGNDKTTNRLIRYRFMVLINAVRDIPIQKESDKNYFIEYSFLNLKERYKIDMQNAIQSGDDFSNFYVPLNRLRMFYLFAQNRKSVNNFINLHQHLQINLFCENKIIGNVQLELSDFLSDQVVRNEYFKVFNGKDLPLLKWSVSVTLGLVASEETNVTRIGLREYQGIYLPNNIYYTCEPLPQEWIETISAKSDHDKQPSMILSKSIVVPTRENANLSYLLKTNRSGFYDIKNDYSNKSPNSKDFTYSVNQQTRLFSASPKKSKPDEALNILELLEQSNVNSSKLLQKKLLNTSSQPYGKKVKLIQQNSLQSHREIHNNRTHNISFSQHLNNGDEENNPRHRSSLSSNKQTKQKSKILQQSVSGLYEVDQFEKSPNRRYEHQKNQSTLQNLLQNEIFSYSKDYGLTDSTKKQLSFTSFLFQ